ncbi:MAG: response regulator [Anaerolineales bacterium]|nr:response regulator [Anaerolineales bacterium]
MAISDPESRYFLPPRPVAAALMLVGWVLGFVAEFARVPGLTAYAVALMLLGACAFWVTRRHELVGRWGTLFAVVAAVHLGWYWLAMPSFLALPALVTTLAYGMVSRSAAFLTAGLQTALILALPASVAEPMPAGLTMLAVGAIWLAVILNEPFSQRLRWMQTYTQQAQQVLEEARDSRSELHERMAELAHANRQLALASDRIATLRMVAEEAERTKSAFVAKVSHEFRTPLNMILGLVSLIVETPEIYDVALPRDLREDLRIVHRNCEHLAGMVNDVLSLTQIEAGRLVLRQEWVSLTEIVCEAVESVRPLLNKKGLKASIETPDDLPDVHCDRTRIRQVILNLVSNAARFTSHGGITVTVGKGNQRVLVRVSDTGPGIAPQDLERIFEPFCQGSAEPWLDRGGTGLGLSISRQLVQLHGGRMWVESELGVGSTFTFDLPLGALAPRTATPGHLIRPDWLWRERAYRTEEAAAPEEWRRPRVVVSDPVGSLGLLLTSYADEVEIVQCPDPDDVARELERCPAHSVITNAATPEDALALASKLRALVSDTPIFACAVPRKVDLVQEASALGYLTKPVSPDALASAIAGLGQPVRQALIVDDDPDALLLFARMLHRCDSTIVVATSSSGEEALEKIRGSHLDLVLLDVRLPGMNGWQVLERIKQESGTTPAVILLSAQDAPDQAPESPVLLLTTGHGLSIQQVLRCSIELSQLLLRVGGPLRREPAQSEVAGLVWPGVAPPQAPAQAPALASPNTQ